MGRECNPYEQGAVSIFFHYIINRRGGAVVCAWAKDGEILLVLAGMVVEWVNTVIIPRS